MQTAIKDRPILFSGPMVQAILDGRKTVTRRVVKPQPEWDGDLWVYADELHTDQDIGGVIEESAHCPYGITGSRLWVREAWNIRYIDKDDGEDIYGDVPCYRANYDGDPREVKWRPSIHMPRWASRITLQVVDVRVERVQEITEKDAVAEGLNGVAEFAELWDELNSARGYPWYSQPWVWRVEFRQLTEG